MSVVCKRSLMSSDSVDASLRANIPSVDMIHEMFIARHSSLHVRDNHSHLIDPNDADYSIEYAKEFHKFRYSWMIVPDYEDDYSKYLATLPHHRAMVDCNHSEYDADYNYEFHITQEFRRAQANVRLFSTLPTTVRTFPTF
jgi:hypothetical protein